MKRIIRFFSHENKFTFKFLALMIKNDFENMSEYAQFRFGNSLKFTLVFEAGGIFIAPFSVSIKYQMLVFVFFIQEKKIELIMQKNDQFMILNLLVDIYSRLIDAFSNKFSASPCQPSSSKTIPNYSCRRYKLFNCIFK